MQAGMRNRAATLATPIGISNEFAEQDLALVSATSQGALLPAGLAPPTYGS
jgi:hypothetical protein